MRENDTPHFAAYFKVRHYEMDALGHVNNAVYLHYLEQAAIEHAAALGFTLERLQREFGGLFIARRHEIDYLCPATAGDTLQVVTQILESHGAIALRGYEIYRHPGDGGDDGHREGLPADRFLAAHEVVAAMLVARARTQWVWADPVAGRPRRMPLALRRRSRPRPPRHARGAGQRTRGKTTKVRGKQRLPRTSCGVLAALSRQARPGGGGRREASGATRRAG